MGLILRRPVVGLVEKTRHVRRPFMPQPWILTRWEEMCLVARRHLNMAQKCSIKRVFAMGLSMLRLYGKRMLVLATVQCQRHSGSKAPTVVHCLRVISEQ